MDYYLTNPNIEGVYETQVSVEFRSVADIGSMCRIIDKNEEIQVHNLQWVQGKISYQNLIKNHIASLYIEIKGKIMALILTSKKLIVLKH